MNVIRPIAFTALLAVLSSGCADSSGAKPADSGTAAGASGGVAAVGGASGGDAEDHGCPAELPNVGESCQTREPLCVYKRRGPCPPDPDQLRQCVNGKWAATAPAILCEPPPSS